MTSNGRIVVRRTAPDDVQERELYVSVDGIRRGILRYGNTLVVEVSAGRHELRVHNTVSRRAEIVDVADDGEVTFIAGNVPAFGYHALATILGIGPMRTVLSRGVARLTRSPESSKM